MAQRRWWLGLLAGVWACAAPTATVEGDGVSAPEVSAQALPDGTADAETAPPDVPEPDTADGLDAAGGATPAPDAPGRFAVGTRSFDWFDVQRNRKVPTQIWYPCVQEGELAQYLGLIAGHALDGAAPDPKALARPVLLFSHGFKGINVQSFSILEHVASHGFVVVAPNHVGNTLTDNASNQEVAQVSLERPRDLAFALAQVLAASQPGGELAGLVDGTRVAVSGHSFGGWTALVVAGGVLDVDAAKAACAAGAPSDIFCKYLEFWPKGATVQLDAAVPGLRAAVYYAPGGYSSFGDPGIGKVHVPGLVMGGTLDDTTTLAAEITPIYAAHPLPKALAVIANASHFSYTDICSLSFAATMMKDYCGNPAVLDSGKAAHIASALTVAWLRRWLEDDAAMASWLQPAAVKARFADLAEYAATGLAP